MLASMETSKVDGLMGFEDDMYEYYDEQEHKDKNKTYFLFEEKNTVSCVGVPFGTLVWSYICWLLAGRPEMKEKEIK